MGSESSELALQWGIGQKLSYWIFSLFCILLRRLFTLVMNFEVNCVYIYISLTANSTDNLHLLLLR